jgi:hypothetical protein
MAKSQIRQYVFTSGVAGAGTIQVVGKIDLSQLLLITNTTKNVILYNFADPTYSGTVITFSRANDSVNFFNALDNSDGITTITLAVNTTGMSSDDQIQIFYDRAFQEVRMPEIGTDAFERTRVANPLSMLDADFEYGLQPTKWLTYELMRGYPSIYEVPGTDQSISVVTTDASTTSGGIGSSLITVVNTTSFPVGWAVGTPITVKGYLNTVSGFARAEGSFLINSISGNVLTYYAKTKVGTYNGEILSQVYTQIRQGSFYTGSSVGSTTFSASAVTTVGTTNSGSISSTTTTVTAVISGTTLVVSGGSPAVGQVLTSTTVNVLAGTYIVSGSGSTWTVNASQTVATTTFTATTNTFTAGGTSSGFAVGQTLSGTNVSNGSIIIVSGVSAVPGVFTGSGGNGTYAVLVSSTVSGITINGTTALSTITVTFGTNHGFVPGNTIITQINSDTGSNNHSLVQGPFYIETIPSLTTLTFTSRSSGQITGTVTGIVYARPDAYFSHRPFDGGVILGTGGPAHGSMAVRMSKKYIRYQSGKAINYNTAALFAPNYDIRSVSATNASPSPITTTSTGTITAGSTTITVTDGVNTINNMLVTGTGIPVGTYILSGGGTNNIVVNIPTVLQINSGTTIIFNPTIQIITDETDHGCQPGARVNVLGVTTSGYNGNYTVGAVIDERTVLLAVAQQLGSVTGVISTPCVMQLINWWGSVVRTGTFDEQNGIFWQWDGQQMAIGRRTSTFQLAGTVTVTPDSNLIAGINTRFTGQLIAGDRIVIRGMTHVVSQVVNDSQLFVTPDYRGSISAAGIKMVKTFDRLIPQPQWNLDRCDGTGNAFNPSGYNITPNKMQMVCLQWTWYGAGFIDYMIRGPEGKYITVHRLRGNNLQYEAFMRSGNQPVRYEVVNEAARSNLTSGMLSTDTTISISDVTYFPTPSALYPAYCYIDNELISYTGKTVTSISQDFSNQTLRAGTLTGIQRGVSLPVYAAGSTRFFTGGGAVGHAANAGVILVGQTATPSISHWGSAFLTDGGFDQDRGYIFNYPSINTQISTRKTTAFAIRLAPSVSNAIIGDLGVRELINRAQLLLQNIEITVGGSTNTNSAVVIEGILNPSNYPTNVSNITWNSLNSTALQTGQPSFSQIATGTSVTFQNNNTVSPTTTIAYPTGSTVISLSSISTVLAGDDVSFPSATTAVLGLTKVSSVATIATTYSGSSVGGGGSSTANGIISGNILTAQSGPSGSGFVVGSMISGTNILSGTYITAILSGSATTAGSTFSVSQSHSLTISFTITAQLFSLTTTGVTGTLYPGLLLTGGSVTAGTYIVQQLSGTSGGAGIYAVNQSFANIPTGASGTIMILNQTLQTSVNAGSIATISRLTYASPGETVFSFISSPNTKDSLDLSTFKELTNTPIGGRGTFPNGPDVLFINVYLTQGSPVLASLVLRWGEAQA